MLGDMHPTTIGSPDDLAKRLGDTGYLCDESLATIGFLALSMPRPLLLEGEPGTGKTALAAGPGDAALVTLVDLPDLDEVVLRRVLGTASGPTALVRATYDGRPGHPVLLGRHHWAGVVATAEGDHGARTYLAAHEPVACECGDLATGRDVDSPEDLGQL